MTTWADRRNRMQASIVGDRGPSEWATYTAPNGSKIKIKGPYESPYRRQTPGDMETETYVVSQEPRFGARKIDFPKVTPARQDGLLVLDSDPGCKFRVTKVEEAQIGWVNLVLEKVS